MEEYLSFGFDLGEMETALLNMPAKVGADVMRGGLQAAGDVILEAMVAHCPERTEGTPGSNALPPGFLKADLHTEIQIKPGFASRVKVGPSSYTSYVAHWMEEGWQPTGHGRSRKSRKSLGERVPGKHFMATASDETRNTASQALLDHLASSLNFSDEGMGAETEYGGEDY